MEILDECYETGPTQLIPKKYCIKTVLFTISSVLYSNDSGKHNSDFVCFHLYFGVNIRNFSDKLKHITDIISKTNHVSLIECLYIVIFARDPNQNLNINNMVKIQ